MKEISVQMINHRISSSWWKNLVKYFVQIGDILEIRCWKEELVEIKKATQYGKPKNEIYEVSIKGVVDGKFIDELLRENPTDKDIYNKMTKYFTINIKSKHYKFCSAHYGTEIYLINISDDDFAFFQKVMKAHEEDFSIHIIK